DAHAEAGGDGGLNARKIGARVGDMPRATRRLERVDGAIAVEAALLEDRERHRAGARIDRMPPAGHPVETLGPGRDAAVLPRVPLDQREIELAALEIAGEPDAQPAAHVEPQARA